MTSFDVPVLHRIHDCTKPALSGKDWASLRSWHRIYGRHDLPWRRTPTPWRVLLAEVLLHRTRALAVENLYEVIANRFPSPEMVLQLRAEWLELTRPAGLAWRAEVFISACERLVAYHHGQVPEGRDALMALPGVGHYIASAVRCFGFQIPGVIVDTNTIRVVSRVAQQPLSPAHHRSRKVGKAVARLSEDGIASTPEDNYALLDLGAMVCHAAKPECARCPIRFGCATGRRVVPTGQLSMGGGN